MDDNTMTGFFWLLQNCCRYS